MIDSFTRNSAAGALLTLLALFPVRAQDSFDLADVSGPAFAPTVEVTPDQIRTITKR